MQKESGKILCDYKFNKKKKKGILHLASVKRINFI